jgi:hypothetical protein
VVTYRKSECCSTDSVVVEPFGTPRSGAPLGRLKRATGHNRRGRTAVDASQVRLLANARWWVRLGDRRGRVRDVDLIWEQVVVDAHDPAALGRWWAEALGWVVLGDAADEFEIRPSPDRVPGLLFVPVPEEKAGKNRLHLDFRPVDQTAEVERLLSLGARRADVGQRDASWVVLADPEGNEFCILRGRIRPDS